MKRYKTRLVDPEKLKYGAVPWAVLGAVGGTVDWAVRRAVYEAADGAVYLAVRGAVGGKVTIR